MIKDYTVNSVRNNKKWLKTTEIDQKVKNRIKRSQKDFVNYFSIDFVKHKFNEEGC